MLDPISAVSASDPYPCYAALRAGPVLALDPRIGLRVAATAAAVEAVLSCPSARVRPPAEPVPRALLGTAAGEIFARLARMNEGARHASLRPSVEAACAGIPVARIAAVARAACDRLEPAALATGRYPVTVIADLLGISAHGLDDVADDTAAFVRALAAGADAACIERGGEASARLTSVFTESAARAFPGLSNEDAVANTLGLLFQSHDATAGLVGNAMVALAEQTGMGDAIRDDRELISGFVQEVARFDPPVQNTRRWMAEDSSILGTPIGAAEGVLLILAAANRDPAANPDPDRFDPRRTNRRSHTFGLGRHACPGATLALALAEAAVGHLVVCGVDPGAWANRTYAPSPNARIPRFGAEVAA